MTKDNTQLTVTNNQMRVTLKRSPDVSATPRTLGSGDPFPYHMMKLLESIGFSVFSVVFCVLKELLVKMF